MNRTNNENKNENEFDLAAIQNAIREFQLDGWLLYDFRASNILALRVLGIDPSNIGSRRFFYFIPANGTPQKLVHRIETKALDHLPGETHVYLTWQQLNESLKRIVDDDSRVAMEYSPNNANPYVSKVDAGTVELIRSFGSEVVSSGNLVQFFEAVWTDEQWQLHLEADRLNQEAFNLAWGLIADHVRSSKPIREMDVQNLVMQYYADHNLTTYHPPIVAVGPNSGNPHYAPQAGSDAAIEHESFVLLDMWAKLDQANAVYSDLTKVGFVGTKVPEKYKTIFDVVAAGRDAGIEKVRSAFSSSTPLQGWQVDQATRDVIESAGYGQYFIHRTGHNIGQETHGNGAHMDNLETQEDRLVMPLTCFSIEPGIYRDDFGIRSEINVYVARDNQVHVTGGLQTEVLPIMAEY